jgi:hypothetical protein
MPRKVRQPNEYIQKAAYDLFSKVWYAAFLLLDKMKK